MSEPLEPEQTAQVARRVVHCERCHTDGAFDSTEMAPAGWYYFTAASEGDGGATSFVIAVCSRACRDHLWTYLPAPPQRTAAQTQCRSLTMARKRCSITEVSGIDPVTQLCRTHQVRAYFTEADIVAREAELQAQGQAKRDARLRLREARQQAKRDAWAREAERDALVRAVMTTTPGYNG